MCEAVPLTQRLGPTASANRADPGPGSIRPSLPTTRSPRSVRHLTVSSATSLPHRDGSRNPRPPRRSGRGRAAGRAGDKGGPGVSREGASATHRGQIPEPEPGLPERNERRLRVRSCGRSCGSNSGDAGTSCLGRRTGRRTGRRGGIQLCEGGNASQFSRGRRSRPPCPPGIGLGPPAPGWVSVGSHRPRGMKRVRRGWDPAARPPPPPSAAGPTALPHSRAAGAGRAWNLTPRAGGSPRGLGVAGSRSPGLPELGSESTARLVTFYELQIK